MIVIGDVHGKFERYKKIVSKIPESIQVGDFGVGFPGHPSPDIINGWHRFIRGNHDSPGVAKKHLNYLGEYGYLEDKGIFYCGGADSIDKAYRTIGIDWWDDEQLSREQFAEATALFTRTKPEIVITHAAPVSVVEHMLSPVYSSLTEAMLERMLELHRPRIWIFGHYHMPFSREIKGTRFVCLNELETMEI